jgi:hypothetical protein
VPRRVARACAVRAALAGLAALAATGAAGAASLTTGARDSAAAAVAGNPCLAADAVPGADRISSRRFGTLTCAAAGPATTQELKLDQGAASWRLGALTADAHRISEVRGTFSLEHFLPLGPLGAWQIHGDVALGRPTLGAVGSAVDEQAHVFMSRSLPWACTLRLAASAIALGTVDPSAALQRSSEIAAELSRGFRLAAAATVHQVTLKFAEQSASDRQSGSDQTTLLTSLSYGHAMKVGAVKADIALTRVEAGAAAIQTVTRTMVSYSRPF